MSPKEYQSKLPPSKVLGIAPDPFAVLLNRKFSRRGAIELVTKAAGVLFVSGCGAAPLPPQGRVPQEDTVNLGIRYGIPTSEPNSALAGLPVPTRAPILMHTPSPTRPPDVQKPSPTPKPTQIPRPTRNSGIHDPKPTSTPIPQVATKEPIIVITDPKSEQDPYARIISSAQTRSDEMPDFDTGMSIAQRVENAKKNPIPQSMQVAIRELLQEAEQQVQVGGNRVVRIRQNVYQSGDNSYYVQVSAERDGSFTAEMGNGNSEKGSHLVWTIEKAQDERGKPVNRMVTGLFTRRADGTHDPLLRAFDYTISATELFMRLKPSIMSDVGIYHTVLAQQAGLQYGQHANYTKFMNMANRQAANELAVLHELMDDPNASLDDVYFAESDLFTQLKIAAGTIHPATVAQGVRVVLRNDNRYGLLPVLNIKLKGKSDKSDLPLSKLGPDAKFIHIDYSLK